MLNDGNLICLVKSLLIQMESHTCAGLSASLEVPPRRVRRRRSPPLARRRRDGRRYQTRRRRLVAGLFGVPPGSSVPRPLTRLLGFLEIFFGNMNRCSCSISAWMRRDPTRVGVPEPRLWSMCCRSESAAPLAPPQLRLPGRGPNGSSLW